MIVVLFIVFLGVIFIGSIMGMTSSGRISKLEQQNRNLNARLKVLEAGQEKTSAPIQSVPAPIAVPDQPVSPSPVSPPLNTMSEAPAPIPPAPKPVSKPKPVPEMGLQPPRIAAASAAPLKTKTAPETALPKIPKPEKPTRNLEELIGGQWSVWVGGLALLVGAVLLIRFSIEAGFFGPGARILMAAGLGVALLAAGEWLKRSDDKILKGKLGQGKLGDTAKALQENASVPGLLSAVGIFTLLGTTYAAHELYGFISAPVAFGLLGIISLGAMALSLRQGPLLAVIGLLASFATPLLIQTQTPNFMMLVGYLLVIGFAGLVLARRTKWEWLETGVVFGWLFWLGTSIEAATGGQLPLWSAFLAIGFGVTVCLSNMHDEGDVGAVKTENQTSDLKLQPILAVVWAVIAAAMVTYITREGQSGLLGFSTPSLLLSLGTIAALCTAAVLSKRQSGHLVIAGVMAAGLGLLSGPNSQLSIFAVAVAFIVLLSLRESLSRDINPLTKQPDIFWSVFAVGLGIGSVVLFHMFSDVAWPGHFMALWMLGYTALFGAAAFFFKSKSRPELITTWLTLGAAAAWAFAAYFAVEGLSLSLALSFGAAICVLAVWPLRLPGARLALLGLAGLVFAHAFLVQFPDTSSLSARPVFNALWAYLALPSAILGAAGYVVHSRKTETKTDAFLNGLIEAAALAGLALFAVFQIRHLSNGGSVYVDKIGFEELGLQVSTGLCFTLAGLSKRFSGNMVLSKMAEVISYATLGIFALGSLAILSPLFSGRELVSGNILFNSLTTGLLVPTVLLAICAWRARGRRSEKYVNVLGGLALLGGMMWLTAMVRFVFNGMQIDIGLVDFGDFELWTISAVWLAVGILLLAAGVWKGVRALRIASGILIIATVLKAFLVDMAGLEGVLRAMSFVVLGLVLIVIGRAYQRFWLSDRPKEVSPAGEGEA